MAALAEIDRLVTSRPGWRLMALLYVVDSADFIFLMNQTGLTWATYRRHMAKLEGVGYIELRRRSRGTRPIPPAVD